MKVNEFRKIMNLHSARRLAPAPNFTKPTSPIAKRGLTYEKKVFNELKSVFPFNKMEHNPWFEYVDDNGPGICCPDILIHDEKHWTIVIIEVKLSYVTEAEEKLRHLYQPIIEKCFNTKTHILNVVKNLRPGAPAPIIGLDEIFTRKFSVIHWFGNYPLANLLQ